MQWPGACVVVACVGVLRCLVETGLECPDAAIYDSVRAAASSERWGEMWRRRDVGKQGESARPHPGGRIASPAIC